LFFDHHKRDPLAYRVLGLSTGVARSRPAGCARRWAMHGAWPYSMPMCAIPYVAMADAGTVEPVHRKGREVSAECRQSGGRNACVADPDPRTRAGAIVS